LLACRQSLGQGGPTIPSWTGYPFWLPLWATQAALGLFFFLVGIVQCVSPHKIIRILS
jgi:hypothetical protein